MATYTGNARVVETNLGSTRTFVLRSPSVAGTGTGDLDNWELNAGESVDLTYRTTTSGASPPGQANTIILRVYYETGTGLLVRELHNGAPPASGTVFTFWATDDGTETGSPRAGTLRMYVQAIRTDLGTYDSNSDGDGDQGVLRAKALVQDLTVSAYPAGSTFAYGTAGDEVITLTATHTQPWGVRGHEDVRIDALDITDQQIVGSVKDVGLGSTTQDFVSGDEFDEAAKSYGMEFVPIGIAQLVPDSNATMLWSVLVDDGANVEQNGDNVRRQSFYNVDPRITMTTPTVGETVYNRLESATHSFTIANARSEQLTRSVSWDIRDSGNAVVASVSDTGSTYSNTRAIGGTEKATNDLVGDQWNIITTLADAFNISDNIYKVSRKRIARQEVGAADGTVFTDKAASPSTDNKTVFNRGQDVFFRTLIFNVRGEQLGSESGFFAPRRTDQEAYELSPVAHTLNAGEFTGSNATYTVPLTSVTPPAGRTLVWTDTNVEQPRTGTGGDGNFAETDVSTAEWTITDQYTVEMRTQQEPDRNTDPEDTIFTIGSDAVYTFTQVLDANGDPVEGAVVDQLQLDPNGIQSDSGQETTQADGWTPTAVFQPNTPKGEWVVRGVVSEHNGNTGTDDQMVQHVSAFTANKATISGFGPVYTVPNTLGRPTAQKGDPAKPGDRVLLGLAFTRDGIRQVVAETPKFMLAQFNQSTGKAEILQSDFTWLDKDDAGFEDHFFDFKESQEGGLEWVASFGTAAQGVTSSNGYVTDTASWEPGGVFMIVSVTFDGQLFYTGRSHPFAGPSPIHPMESGDLPESLVGFDTTDGHTHDGADSKPSFRRFGPTGLFE